VIDTESGSVRALHDKTGGDTKRQRRWDRYRPEIWADWNGC
jgi:hypothetical protein